MKLEEFLQSGARYAVEAQPEPTRCGSPTRCRSPRWSTSAWTS